MKVYSINHILHLIVYKHLFQPFKPLKMRNLFTLLFLSSLLFLHINSRAQTGWQWGRKNSGRGGMNSRPSAIDAAGNLYVIGTTYGTAFTIDSMTFGSHKVYSNGRYAQMIITKNDSSGNYLWAIGSQNADIDASAISIDLSGNLFIVGFYDDTSAKLGNIVLTNPRPDLPMSYIAKISSSGNVLWAQNVIQVNCGSATDPIDMGVGTDALGNAYVTENFYQNQLLFGSNLINNKGLPSITGDVLILKYGSTGTLEWAKSFGGDYEDYPFVQDGGWFGADYNNNILAVTPSGHFYIAGTFYSDSIKIGSTTLYNPYGSSNTPGPTHNYLSKWDNNGNNIWVKYIEKKTSVNEIITNANEEIFITGELDSADTWGQHALTPGSLVAKLDSSGNIIWVRTDNGGDGKSIGIDSSENVFVAGQFIDSVDFSGHILQAPPGNGSKIFIAQYDRSGNYLSSVAVPDGAISSISVRPDKSGHYYLVGNQFDIKLIFGPDVLDTSGIEAITTFIARYKYANTSGVASLSLNNDVLVYPNPSNNFLNIAMQEKIYSVKITDLYGRNINLVNCNNERLQLDVSNIPIGVYIIQINDSIVRKFVKE